MSTRLDTVAGTVRVDDSDGIDSVWVTLETTVIGENGGFDQVFSAPYKFVVQGFQPSEHIPLTFRARDVAGFVVQRDTYVVVIP